MSDTQKQEDVRQHDLVEIQPSIIQTVDKYDLETAEYDVLVQMGMDVSEAKTYAQWVLGKLGDAAAKKFGDLKQYAQDIHIKYETLQQYMNVYRKFISEDPNFSPEKYMGSVPWGVLQLAAYKTDKPQEMVDSLQDKNMAGSVEAGHRGILEEQTGVSVPSKPKVKLKWNKEVSKYAIEIDEADFDIIDWGDIGDRLRNYLQSLS